MRKYKICLLLVIFLLIAYPPTTQSKSPYLGPDPEKIIPIDLITDNSQVVKYIDILPDPTNIYTIDSIQAPIIQNKFKGEDKKFLLLDYLDKGYYWIRITYNREKEDTGWYLIVDDSLIPNIELYVPTPQGYRLKQKQGIFNTSSLSDRYRNFVFPLPTPSGMTTVYLHMNYYSFANIPIMINSSKTINSYLINNNNVFCICYGILLAMILYNLFVFVILKKKIYLAYINYMLGVLIFSLSYYGQLALWLDLPTKDTLFSYLSWQWIGLSWGFIWGLVFIKLFLNTRENTPKVDVMLNICIFMSTGIMLFGLSGHHYIADFISYLLGFMIPTTAIIAGVIRFRNGYKPATYFLIAWIISLVQMFLFSLRGIGLAPPGLLTQYGPVFGPTIESILLSIALAANIQKLEYEKKQSILNKLKVEDELDKANDLLRNVIDSMPSIIITTDNEGIINKWNMASSIITGIPEEDAVKHQICSILPMFENYRDLFREVVATKHNKQLRREQIVIGSSGVKQYYDMSIFTLSENAGMVVRLDNVTEVARKDQELQQTQKMDMVGTLAGGLAHDFNNVLTGINGVISLLLTKVAKKQEISSEEFIELLQTANNSGKRAVDMVKQLLTLSHQNEPNMRTINLISSINNVVKICRRTIDKSIDIRYTVPEKESLVKADPTQIEQVLLNLFINAEHAMTIMRKPEEVMGGVLTVTIDKIVSDINFRSTHSEAEDINYWKISVSDTGVGMDKKTAAKIFDPFYTTKERGKGTGLGLSVTYNIIKQHNGFIDLYSEEGLGTTFNVYIPVSLSCIEADEEEIEAPRGTGTILIVDDEENVRIVAKNILKYFGYDAILAVNGKEGIEKYKEHQTDIVAVLLDMIMPVMSGREAYIAMKEINPEVKVLLASGFRLDERAEHIMKLGVNGFIQKPYLTNSLAQAIYDVIMGKQVDIK